MTASWVIVSGPFPGFDTVTTCEVLLPTVALPKFRLAGLAVIWGCAATPIPLRLTSIGEFGALLLIEIFPVALPPVVGANFAEKDALWPAAIVRGAERPLMLKPVPETLACEIEILADPELVKVMVEDPFEPTVTLPNPTVCGLTARLPCAPDPLKGIDRVELLALLVTSMFPTTFPEVVGAK